MYEFRKIMGRLIFTTALSAHFILLALFFAPTPFLVSHLYQDQAFEIIRFKEIPEAVKASLKEKKLDFPLMLDNGRGWRETLIASLLEGRRAYFMDSDEQLAFDLTFLNFGEGVVGMEAASQYYYQKSLSTISDTEWMTLISLHTIFSK